MTTAIEVDPHDPNTVRVGSTYWRLWQSDAGIRYATRGGGLTDEQMQAGCEATIAADTPEELEGLLLEQPEPRMREG